MQTRRKFLKNSGALAAGSAFLTYCGPATEQKKVEQVVQTQRNIGVQLYTLRHEIDKDVVGTLTKAAEIGYKEIEIYDPMDGKYFGMTPAEFTKLLDSLGMKLISGHYRSGRELTERVGTLSKDWEIAVEAMEKAGQKYAALGWLHESERNTLDQYKELVDMINPAAELCKSAGIQFCYHNHDFEFIELEGEIPMYYILDNTDSELVKMELDLFWVNKVNLDPIAFFEKYPGRVPLWHVKDSDVNKDFTEVGNGTIDFKKIFENQELAGMQHFFVEQDESDDAIQSITTSFKYVSENLV